MTGDKTRVEKMVGGARVETGAEGVRWKSRVQPRRCPKNGVEGGRSHGVELLIEAIGTTDGDRADGEGAQSADRDPMDRHETAGFGGHDGTLATTP